MCTKFKICPTELLCLQHQKRDMPMSATLWVARGYKRNSIVVNKVSLYYSWKSTTRLNIWSKYRNLQEKLNGCWDPFGNSEPCTMSSRCWSICTTRTTCTPRTTWTSRTTSSRCCWPVRGHEVLPSSNWIVGLKSWTASDFKQTWFRIMQLSDLYCMYENANFCVIFVPSVYLCLVCILISPLIEKNIKMTGADVISLEKWRAV